MTHDIYNNIKLLFILFILVPIILQGCNSSTFACSNNRLYNFDIKLVDVGFISNTNIFSTDTLSLPRENLAFKVDITPNNSFTGEPFTTIKLGNENIGYQTLIQSTPPFWLVLLSKDGYFFNAVGPITWTPSELQLPDASERNYNTIQLMKQLRIKTIYITAPSSDIACVSLLQDSNELAAELQKKQWQWLISGEWLLGENLPEEADEEYIRSEFEQLFNKYFELRIVNADGLQKLKYPDGQTKSISKWSGTGSFTSPVFTVAFDILKTSWIGTPSGKFEYTLFNMDGTVVGGYRGGAEPNNKHESGNPVIPENSYYIEITAPTEMKWTFWVNETNIE